MDDITDKPLNLTFDLSKATVMGLIDGVSVVQIPLSLLVGIVNGGDASGDDVLDEGHAQDQPIINILDGGHANG